MAFVDEIRIWVKSGDGGDGVVRWLHEKGKEWSGPSGGNGGHGGDVYIVAVRDVHLLSKYRAMKEFKAERGGDGAKDSLHGADGKDLEVKLPLGSVVTNVATLEKYQLGTEGQKILILRGGGGGRGNESFKSSRNQSPEESTPGKPGEEAEFDVEIELVADISLIGFPNAGKSSLLNELSNSKSRVGAYPFTTLEPSLGEMYGFIIADIPGLIEGASEGKGLGHKFLRHIRRTRLIAHLISLENEDPIAAYRSIRAELEKFDPALTEKKEIVILTKTDLISDQGNLEKIINELKQINPLTTSVTVYDNDSLAELRNLLIEEAGK